MEFFPHRTCAYKRIAKRYPVTAGVTTHTLNKMDFLINAEFNLAKASFTG